MRLISILLFATSALLAQSATAQVRIFCCQDDRGTKVCGDFLPPVCQGRAYEERDSHGFISKNVEAPLTPEQQARRDAEKLRKDEEVRKAAEERRRNLALLATYSSEKDINSARDRALAEVDKNMKQSQQRLDEANKKKKKLENDREFYKGKPLPDQVKAEIRDNEKEIAAQQAAVAAKVKEAEEVRGRFAEEKKRYLELTGKKSMEATPAPDAAPAAPAAAPAAVKPAAPTAAVKPADKK